MAQETVVLEELPPRVELASKRPASIPVRPEPQSAPGIVEPQRVPNIILKQTHAVWLYLVAVFSLALVVVIIPLVSVWGKTMPPELWTGWNVCIGGLIALIGAQGNGAQGDG